jgi:hypothetical protein
MEGTNKLTNKLYSVEEKGISTKEGSVLQIKTNSGEYTPIVQGKSLLVYARYM